MIIALPEIATLSWFAWTERSTPEFTWEVSLGKNSENILQAFMKYYYMIMANRAKLTLKTMTKHG